MTQQIKTASGVRIICEHMPYARSVSMGIWVNAGSNHERLEEAGLAHFIEHMLFKGTTTRSAKEIAEQFDRLGGELNAFTSKESTCYHTTVLSKDAPYAFEMLIDMLTNSVFDPVEIAREKEVILEEIAMCEDTPDDEVHEKLWEVMYKDHPFGKPVLGTPSSVQKFTSEMIRAFMERLYVKDRIVISVAGNLEPSFLARVEQLCAQFLDNKQGAQPALEKPSFHHGESVLYKEIEQAHYCIGYPSISHQDERKYALGLIDSIIGSSMSSRLFQEVREKLGLAYAIYSYYSIYEEGGAFVIYGGTALEKLPLLKQTILAQMDLLLAEGVTDVEMEQAKQAVKNSFLLALETTESVMTRNGQQLVLTNQLITVETVLEKVEQVTKREVEALLVELFSHPFAESTIMPNKE